MKCRIRFAMLLLVLPATCAAQLSAASDPTKSDPIAYLNRALDLMQTQALRRNTVDWPKTRAAAIAMAAHADSTVGTYDAIRFALASLGDHHSSLHPTPALEASKNRRKRNILCPNSCPRSRRTSARTLDGMSPKAHRAARQPILRIRRTDQMLS